MDNKSNYLEKLKKTLEGGSSKDALLGLMDETVGFFRDLRSKLESNDPKDQENAFEETMEIKKMLESKIQSLCEMTGMSFDQLAALSKNLNQMTPEERQSVETAQAKLQEIQK